MQIWKIFVKNYLYQLFVHMITIVEIKNKYVLCSFQFIYLYYRYYIHPFICIRLHDLNMYAEYACFVVVILDLNQMI